MVTSSLPAPLSPKQVLLEAWGEKSEFETYAIRKVGSESVDATLFKINRQARDLIAEWEMIHFGWYAGMLPNVTAYLPNDPYSYYASTEGLGEIYGTGHEQAFDRVANGRGYHPYLNDPLLMHEQAERTRLEYLARQSQS